MAVLSNGLETIELGSTAWRHILNSNWKKLYTKNETDGLLNAKEDKANKVTSWQTTPDDAHYPSEKLVKDSLDQKANINGDPTQTFSVANPSSDNDAVPKGKLQDLDFDIIFTDSSKGPVLIDRNDGTQKRLYVDGGVLHVESV